MIAAVTGPMPGCVCRPGASSSVSRRSSSWFWRRAVVCSSTGSRTRGRPYARRTGLGGLELAVGDRVGKPSVVGSVTGAADVRLDHRPAANRQPQCPGRTPAQHPLGHRRPPEAAERPAGPHHRRVAPRTRAADTRPTGSSTTRGSPSGDSRACPARPATPVRHCANGTVWRLCSRNGWWSVFGEIRGKNGQVARVCGARRRSRALLHRGGAELPVAGRHHRAPHGRRQAPPVPRQGCPSPTGSWATSSATG